MKWLLPGYVKIVKTKSLGDFGGAVGFIKLIEQFPNKKKAPMWKHRDFWLRL